MTPVLRGTATGKKLAEDLLSIPGFKKLGQYTFRLDLADDTTGAAREALDVVWQVAAEMAGQSARTAAPDAEPAPRAYPEGPADAPSGSVEA